MVTGAEGTGAKGFSRLPPEPRAKGSSCDEKDGWRADGGRAAVLLKFEGKEMGGPWCVRALGGR
jgi:hypothetical protein